MLLKLLPKTSGADLAFMRLALRLAKLGYGETSPNPIVGAVLVKNGVIVGRGWHRRAGEPHAEIEAIRDAQKRGCPINGTTLYVTLEPCCTHGRTPPCTDAILACGIRRVVVAANDPNPNHSGKGCKLLHAAGIEVRQGLLGNEAAGLNEAFNHWIVQRAPFVTVKSAMSLDGKIATVSGESKWITSERARAYAMKLRQGADALLAGVNTILADDPSLTFRPESKRQCGTKPERLRRIVLDSKARTPISAKVIADERSTLTTVVVTEAAPRRRVQALEQAVAVWTAPVRSGQLDLVWVLNRLGAENVTSLLVEGGGEVNASFLMQRLAQRVAFFYAPKILGGRQARKAVGGEGIVRLGEGLKLADVEWCRFGPDFFVTGRIPAARKSRH